MRTLVPGYPAVLAALEEAQELMAFPGPLGSGTKRDGREKLNLALKVLGLAIALW